MAERRVTIRNEKGLHVRPAAAFAQAAGKFSSRISVCKDSRIVNGKSSIELLMLAAEPGASLMIRAEGDDAETAAASLAKFVEDHFGMGDE
ncbi:MAG: HPr family phosphocarrier protein [Planctomycetes bacterium]|nr:HPr family phosphocarrier protein [Planctomycetota bacterium]